MRAYCAGRRHQFDLPLDLGHGTPFQQLVWHALLQIERGQTTSYGALARSIDRPRAVRAVGAAVGRNPLSIVLPCHRVLGADGRLISGDILETPIRGYLHSFAMTDRHLVFVLIPFRYLEGEGAFFERLRFQPGQSHWQGQDRR